LNEKIKRANEQIKKNNIKGHTYKSGMAGPRVPNVVDDEQSDSKEQRNVYENMEQKEKENPSCLQIVSPKRGQDAVFWKVPTQYKSNQQVLQT
jgi:hypothetical protein